MTDSLDGKKLRLSCYIHRLGEEGLKCQIQRRIFVVREFRNHCLPQFCIFSGNIFICHKMQSDSPVGPVEIENEVDWFLSANVMYKIGGSALYPELCAMFL